MPRMRLQRQDGGPRGLTRFQVAVRLLHILQGVALRDVNFHGATLHHGKQLVGHGLGGFARGNVREQGLPRDIQRALGAQRCRRKRQSSDCSQVSLPTES